MINAWLIVNEFLNTDKFKSTRELFTISAQNKGIDLKTVTNAELIKIPDTLPDFAILWDKDYCLAKRLENRGLRLFNSADAMATCDNKALTYLKLESKVLMPKTIIAPMTFLNIGYNNVNFLDKAIENLGLPLVIKEVCGSFGQQVYLCDTYEKAAKMLVNIGGKGAIMQELIKSSYGVDLRLNVVGNKVISAMKRTGDGFISNITSGGKAENYIPTKEETEIALKACEIIGLDFAGVDLLFGENGPLLCEVNSNLQFRSALNVTGINLADSIFDYILGAL